MAEVTPAPTETPAPTPAPTETAAPTPPPETIQTQSIMLQPDLTLTVQYQITAGEILVSTLLTLLIVVQLTKWGQKVIMGRFY